MNAMGRGAERGRTRERGLRGDGVAMYREKKVLPGAFCRKTKDGDTSAKYLLTKINERGRL